MSLIPDEFAAVLFMFRTINEIQRNKLSFKKFVYRGSNYKSLIRYGSILATFYQRFNFYRFGGPENNRLEVQGPSHAL